jgi:hypothetical protein
LAVNKKKASFTREKFLGNKAKELSMEVKERAGRASQSNQTYLSTLYPTKPHTSTVIIMTQWGQPRYALPL